MLSPATHKNGIWSDARCVGRARVARPLVDDLLGTRQNSCQVSVNKSKKERCGLYTSIHFVNTVTYKIYSKAIQ